ncbi:MAG TPA: hypothetical protein PLP23_13275 [Panacibacter sp.]|nr:hypothetical protein [Panacibacter sp.]
MGKNLLISIYSHPEMYPPTLYAIHELSAIYKRVIVLHRTSFRGNWEYPANVILISHGKPMSIRQQEQLSVFNKIMVFTGFTFKKLQLIFKHNPSTILLYDSFSLLSFHSIKLLLKKRIVWYHSHDIPELNSVRKYSIAWFSFRVEKKAFRYIDIFTLPAIERLQHFPLDNFTGQYFVVPNYPLLKFYKRYFIPKNIQGVIRIIFQGHISELHGIEEIICLLPAKVYGNDLYLILKGPCREEYRNNILKKAAELGVLNKIEFKGITPYSEIPIICSSCHIGIGIHAKNDLMNASLGSASNKLYEYAAVGLPVLYYKNEHFTSYLSKYKWAFATTLSATSILLQIESIVKQYKDISIAANNDFLNDLNFEKHFNKVLQIVLDKLSSNRSS